jgi:deoxyribonuclease IV
MSHILGSHVIDTGGLDMAVRRAANAGLNSLQFFTAPPVFYGDKSSIRGERVERFKGALAETGIRAEDVLVHGAYVLSVATPEPDKWARASGGITKELERSSTLGVGAFCFHPGSAMKSDTVGAAERVGTAILKALESRESATRVLVENTAGAGRTLGRTPVEIANILSHIPSTLRHRTGYGLDTCHLYASGFDISKSRENFKAILDEFEETIGEPPRFFHLNDSEGELGSNRDRHALLGRGRIGSEPFRWLLEDPRSIGIPLILETPQANMEIAADDPSADPYDIEMNGLLRSFLGT